MARVYNKNTDNKPQSNELTTVEACTLLRRCKRWFSAQKKIGAIAPIYKYGNEYIYDREDVLALKERKIIRF